MHTIVRLGTGDHFASPLRFDIRVVIRRKVRPQSIATAVLLASNNRATGAQIARSAALGVNATPATSNSFS